MDLSWFAIISGGSYLVVHVMNTHWSSVDLAQESRNLFVISVDLAQDDTMWLHWQRMLMNWNDWEFEWWWSLVKGKSFHGLKNHAARFRRWLNHDDEAMSKKMDRTGWLMNTVCVIIVWLLWKQGLIRTLEMNSLFWNKFKSRLTLRVCKFMFVASPQEECRV